MRAGLRTYWRLLVAGFRQQSTYRLAALGGLIANATFGFLKVAVLFATVRAAGGQLNGYDQASMSAYIWLSQGLLGSVNLHGRSDIADRIKDGQIAIDFLRPLDVQGASVVTEVGKALFALIPRGIPSVLLGVVFVGMSMPSTPLPYVLGLLSVILGITIGCTSVYLVATAGFWMIETRGVQVLYMIVSGFLAGLFVPISLFPTWLRVLAEATPFPSMMMYPIDVLSGRADTFESLQLVGLQVFWLALTGLVGHSLTSAGRQKLEVQGG
ncbi:ABC transporter permease [Luteipulveratus mongoliensis]|uniref:ABC transporter permease n=1 Tax=Luteipulveratus mongoliensis TaxID=571913 RepID=A0A0K1JMU7_9MICO|nr:ABC-2 family transporter protein [Luteipulveratus mongoliensis]AKU18031.1 ABC transporter permease [Luteipulveratus mongoliensis]